MTDIENAAQEPTEPHDGASSSDAAASSEQYEPTVEDYAALERQADAETEGGNGEAARYRRRLRDTETERDGLATQVRSLQLADVERLAADRLAQPGDLIEYGPDLSAMLDEDGHVDAQRVAAAVAGLLSDRPGLAKTEPRLKGPIMTGHQPPSPGGQGSWADVLQNPGKHQ